MKIGYARTSTLHQVYGLEAQIEKLKNYGCEKIYTEQRSSVYDRPILDKVREIIRARDELVVCSLDRLARNMQHFEAIFKELKEKDVNLKILNLGIDFSGALGKLMLQLLMSFAEFERTNMLERQRAGIEKARAKGMFGRHLNPKKEAAIKKAFESFDPDLTSIVDLSKQLGVSAPTLYSRIKTQYPEVKTKRLRRQQIINEKFNGDATAYKMYRILSKMSQKQRQQLKEAM